MNVSKNTVLAWVQQAYNTLVVHDSHKLVYANYNLWEVSVVEAVKRLEKNNKGLVSRTFSNGKKVFTVEIDDSISEKAYDDLIPRMVTYQEVQTAFKKRFRKIRNLLARKKKEKEVEEMYKEGLDEAKSYSEKYPEEDIKSRQFFWFFLKNMIEVEVEE
jgi:hypothetical protein